MKITVTAEVRLFRGSFVFRATETLPERTWKWISGVSDNSFLGLEEKRICRKINFNLWFSVSYLDDNI